MAEVVHRGRVRLGDLVVGQVHLAQLELHIALLRQAQGVVQHLRDVGEQGLHLLRCVHVVPGALKCEVGFRHRLLGLGAKQYLVGRLVLLRGVVGVGGGDHLDTVLLAQGQDLLIDLLLTLDAVPLDLQIEILAKQSLKLLDRVLGGLGVVVHQRPGDDASQAGRADDNALVILLQHLPCDIGLAVEVVEGLRCELQQVLIPLEVLGQQDQVVALQLALQALLICLKAKDRLLTGLPHGLVVLQEPVHVAVVGQGPGVLSPFDHLRHLGHAVHERVIAVPVQIRKADHQRRLTILPDNDPVPVQAKTGVVKRDLFDLRVLVPAERPAAISPANMQVGARLLWSLKLDSHVCLLPICNQKICSIQNRELHLLMRFCGFLFCN